MYHQGERLLSVLSRSWLIGPVLLGLLLVLPSSQALSQNGQMFQASPNVQTVPALAPRWQHIPGEAAVLVDASGAQTVDQVRARFEAGQGRAANPDQIMPTGGGRALWYQLKLPDVSAATALTLALPHPGMDSVELYRPGVQSDQGASWQLQRSGDGVAVAQWPVRHLHPAFEFVLRPNEAQPTYLRVQHSQPIGVHWVLWDASSFQEDSKRWHLLLGGYIGLVVLMVLLSVANAWSWRDSIHLYFAAYMLVITLAQLSLMGLAGEYFWPHNPWWNDRASTTLSVASVALLHPLLRQLVMERSARWLSYWLLVMTALGAIVVVGFLAIGRKPFFTLSAPYYLASFASYLGVAAWYAWYRPRVGWWVLAALAALVGGAIFPVLRNLGLMPMTLATQYGAQMGIAIEIPLLLIALYLRGQAWSDNPTHVNTLTRVDPLMGVASHRVMMEQLAQLVLRQQRDPGVGAVLRIRVNNAQAIRQDYGTQAAQSALVQALACVTSVAREGDTVARHRDGDFVLILQSRITHEQLTDIGQRLIAHGLAENTNLPPGAVLQLNIAVAQAPFRAPDASSLLQTLGAVLAELGSRPGTALRFVS